MNDPPDVALVDVYLGGSRDGIEVARWLREVCGVPIVFVTANNDTSTVDRIHEQVPDAPVLPKPVFRGCSFGCDYALDPLWATLPHAANRVC
jgi:CheY-like chemotaxis protein